MLDSVTALYSLSSEALFTICSSSLLLFVGEVVHTSINTARSKVDIRAGRIIILKLLNKFVENNQLKSIGVNGIKKWESGGNKICHEFL